MDRRKDLRTASAVYILIRLIAVQQNVEASAVVAWGRIGGRTLVRVLGDPGGCRSSDLGIRV